MYSVLVLELVILVLEANHQYLYSKILSASWLVGTRTRRLSTRLHHLNLSRRLAQVVTDRTEGKYSFFFTQHELFEADEYHNRVNYLMF